jgi:hypothetical protein
LFLTSSLISANQLFFILSSSFSFPAICLFFIRRHHLTSLFCPFFFHVMSHAPQMTSHHVTSYHLTSPQMTSHLLASHFISSLSRLHISVLTPIFKTSAPDGHSGISARTKDAPGSPAPHPNKNPADEIRGWTSPELRPLTSKAHPPASAPANIPGSQGSTPQPEPDAQTCVAPGKTPRSRVSPRRRLAGGETRGAVASPARGDEKVGRNVIIKVRNFPCQTLKIRMVSLAVMGS